MTTKALSAAIAKGASKGVGVGDQPANASLVLKAVAVKVALGHGVESYWDKDDAINDGLETMDGIALESTEKRWD